MKELVINCNNKSEKLSAIAFLYALGYQWNSRPTLKDYVEQNTINFEYYPHVLLRRNYSTNGMYIDAIPESWAGAHTIDFADVDTIPAWLEDTKVQTIKISKDYDAIVSKAGGIEVGCQKISFVDFDKLAAIVAKFR